MTQPDQTAKIETCDNRFELISRWGQPVDKWWAHAELSKWLERRVDAYPGSVYDADIPSQGSEHAKT